ncbi:MAG: fasciclin domain-containing protein [archaeon]|nr:fasciclin domain-containing protein [archaeon]
MKSEYVNDSKIVKPEIEASNGVIHIIDRVLIPSSP